MEVSLFIALCFLVVYWVLNMVLGVIYGKGNVNLSLSVSLWILKIFFGGYSIFMFWFLRYI